MPKYRVRLQHPDNPELFRVGSIAKGTEDEAREFFERKEREYVAYSNPEATDKFQQVLHAQTVPYEVVKVTNLDDPTPRKRKK